MINYKNILRELVLQQITLRYRRTIFGYLWTLFNPLLMMIVTSIVFSTLLKMDLKSYAVFLFSGIIAYNYFSNCVGQCASSIVINEGLIKKIYIPVILFPIATSLALLIDSFLMAVSLTIIMLFVGVQFSVDMILIIPAYILLYMFTLGVSLIASVLTVYLRDLQHVIGIAMQALMFLSPVYYKPDSLSSKVAAVMRFNPLTYYIEMFRLPLTESAVPSGQTYLIAFFVAAGTLALGIWYFTKNKNKLVFSL
jgi:ABC-2 type transport system permease protein/lipopolysaccharide transport system permease protein